MANVERILQLLNEVWIEKRLFGSWKSIFFIKYSASIFFIKYSAMFVHRICLSSKKLTNSTNSLDSKIEKVKKMFVTIKTCIMYFMNQLVFVFCVGYNLSIKIFADKWMTM